MSESERRRPNDGKRYHILGAAANLLGICFVLITGLHISNNSLKTYADEVAFVSSFLFLMSCFLSYISIRARKNSERPEQWADYCFMAGIGMLFIAMTMLTSGF